MSATLHSIQGSLPVEVDDNLPTVRVMVEDDAWDVKLEVTRQVDLPALFDAIAQNFVLKESMRRLMFNQKNPSIRREALANLLQDAAIRAALTITVSPGQAETLGIALDDASREPFPRCEWYEGGGGCNSFITDKHPDYCPEHQLVDAERRALDGGRTAWDD